MTRISDVIGDALALTERAENNAARLVNAMEKINEPDTPLINVNARLNLFDLKQHELHAKNREYEAATTHAETHLLNLINAVENVRNVENRPNEWI